MKRALAAIAFGLAACSSGGRAGEFATQDAAPTPTTRDPAEAFSVQIGVELDGDTPEMREQAAGMARTMCDLLDATMSGPAADDASNDNAATDAVISASLTEAALGVAADTGLSPEVTARLMRAGAKHFCPQHSDTVEAYTASME